MLKPRACVRAVVCSNVSCFPGTSLKGKPYKPHPFAESQHPRGSEKVLQKTNNKSLVNLEFPKKSLHFK